MATERKTKTTVKRSSAPNHVRDSKSSKTYSSPHHVRDSKSSKTYSSPHPKGKKTPDPGPMKGNK